MYPGAGSMGGMPPTGPGQHGMGPQSPMNSPMQQQRRIDPDQMPSPVTTTCTECRENQFSEFPFWQAVLYYPLKIVPTSSQKLISNSTVLL